MFAAYKHFEPLGGFLQVCPTYTFKQTTFLFWRCLVHVDTLDVNHAMR